MKFITLKNLIANIDEIVCLDLQGNQIKVELRNGKIRTAQYDDVKQASDAYYMASAILEHLK